MADTENAGEEVAAEAAATSKKKAATKKKTVKKAASKKVVAKKATRKKATKKVAAASVEAAPPAPSQASTSASPAGAAAPAASSPPVWDDQSEKGVIDLVVQFGPVILLIVLMIVLGSSEHSPATAAPAAASHSSLDSANQSAPASMVDTGSSIGAIELSSQYDPWTLDSNAAAESIPSGVLPSLDALPSTDGTGLGVGSLQWDDPGAFYWGPTVIDEAPPAPSGD